MKEKQEWEEINEKIAYWEELKYLAERNDKFKKSR